MEYLQHWWSGDLATYCANAAVDIDKVNKIIRLIQYGVGLLGVFELIEFSRTMYRLAMSTRLTVYMIRVTSLMFNMHILAMQLLLGVVIAITQRISLKSVMSSAFKSHAHAASGDAVQQAHDNFIVDAFLWLGRHPLKPSTQRGILFVSFAILSLLDILTTQ